MTNTAIKVENLSKIYRLGEIGTGTISRDMERWFKTKILKQEDPFLKIGETNVRANKGVSDIVYSLQNLNFEISQGDAVGIIGRNGAGKSTLLKILSRVTTPTTGRINIKGRVASLLEVGTGFHPELTGRENIYLNGAILGMRKREIDRKLDEIIDFSGVERYIDTPVKRFSSGMYVRLAFAVAAHLESEILIVDEVLAVGDAEFQKKCLGKMGEVSKGEGRTVLFVSHTMQAIKALCSKGIFMQDGQLVHSGKISDSINRYLDHNKTVDDCGNIPIGNSTYNTGIAFFKKVLIKSKVGASNAVYYRSPIELHIELDMIEAVDNAMLDLKISNSDNLQIVHASNKYDALYYSSSSLKRGLNNINVVVDNYLQPGKYSFTLGVHDLIGVTLDYVENIVAFEVLRIGEGDNLGYVFNWNLGIVRFESKWQIE